MWGILRNFKRGELPPFFPRGEKFYVWQDSWRRHACPLLSRHSDIDADVGTVLPDLRRLLAVPAPRQEIVAWLQILRYMDFVDDVPVPRDVIPLGGPGVQ